MGWDGMGWDGMGWDGMGWDGMGEAWRQRGRRLRASKQPQARRRRPQLPRHERRSPALPIPPPPLSPAPASHLKPASCARAGSTLWPSNTTVAPSPSSVLMAKSGTGSQLGGVVVVVGG
jgi:hypothetical protein